jgi:hypothetical protein
MKIIIIQLLTLRTLRMTRLDLQTFIMYGSLYHRYEFIKYIK